VDLFHLGMAQVQSALRVPLWTACYIQLGSKTLSKGSHMMMTNTEKTLILYKILSYIALSN